MIHPRATYARLPRGRSPRTALSGEKMFRPVLKQLVEDERTARYLTFGEDRHPSEVLLNRSEGWMRMGELWDYMLARDLLLKGLSEKRKKAILSRPRFILPRDETSDAKDIAHFCRHVVSEIPSFHINLAHQLDVTDRGYAADEILWRPIKRGPFVGKWGLDLLPVEIRSLLYRKGQLYARRRHGNHMKAPDHKFLINRNGKASPWGGLGLLHFVYWWWWACDRALKYYLIYLEKFAQPTVVGRYPQRSGGNENEWVTMLQEAIEMIATEYGVVLPQGLDLDFKQITHGADISYQHFIMLVSRAKALLYLGEIDTSGLMDHGSFAKNVVSNDVRLETLKVDAHELDAHLTDNFLRRIVSVNFGPLAPVPVWFTDTSDAEDLVMRQTSADRVLDRGLPVPREYYYRVNRTPIPREGEEVITAQSEDSEPVSLSDFVSNRNHAAAMRYRLGDLDDYLAG